MSMKNYQNHWDWLSIMGFKFQLVIPCPACVTGENLSQTLWKCVCFLTVMPSPWSNVGCRTVFFRNGLWLELQTAPCESISHRKVDMKGVFSVSVAHWHVDRDKRIRKEHPSKAAKCGRISSHGVGRAENSFHWSCMTWLAITQWANNIKQLQQ